MRIRIKGSYLGPNQSLYPGLSVESGKGVNRGLKMMKKMTDLLKARTRTYCSGIFVLARYGS